VDRYGLRQYETDMRRTYHTLISPGKGKTRLEQVIEWVGGPDFDGAIVFDEAHKVIYRLFVLVILV
jgi:hypothetical protein